MSHTRREAEPYRCDTRRKRDADGSCASSSMSVELQRVLSHFAAVDGKGKCPFCGHHSMMIDPGKKTDVLVHCFNCPQRQVELARLANEVARDATVVIKPSRIITHAKRAWSEDELNERLTTAQKNLLTDTAAQNFLADRGISLELAQSFGLGAGDYYWEDRVVIPYFDGELAESLLQLRYRRIREMKSKVTKWRCEKRMLGGRRLFNLPLLRLWDAANPKPLILTEAELDCMMLAALGINSCSVDTAGHRLVEEDLLLLRTVKHLVLAFDQDDPGEKCTARFKGYLPHARVLGGYAAPNVKDLGDLRAAMGHEAFDARLRRFCERAMQ